MSIEVPHLPFEGGLPEVRDPKANRRRRGRHRASPLQLPKRTLLQRFMRWAGEYLPRWMHDYSVRLAVGLTMGALGTYYGIEYLAPRSPEVQLSAPKFEEPAPAWRTEVLPAP